MGKEATSGENVLEVLGAAGPWEGVGETAIAVVKWATFGENFLSGLRVVRSFMGAGEPFTKRR